MHMPKCGGTSIAEAMYATVGMGKGVAVIDAVSTRRAAAIMAFDRDDAQLCHEDLPHGDKVFALREQLMLQQMAWGARLIHGHILFSTRVETHFGDAYRLVTLLREPVSRMLSNYRMAVRAGLVGDDLDAYLASGLAQNHARVYLRYLGGRNDIPENEIAETLTLAKRRLDRFAVVGLLENLDGFRRRYAAEFGVPLRIHTYNRATERAPEPSSAQRARLAELCAPDTAIYQAALAQDAA